jgi:hypothetical protein
VDPQKAFEALDALIREMAYQVMMLASALL